MRLSTLLARFPARRCHWHTAFLLAALVVLLAACASSAGPDGGFSRVDASNRITACKSTDQQIASRAQCLQDDAACYQTSNGQWCTGERGSVCPAGSTPIAAGTACPAGARCFRISESLECKV